ncbi:hypothetical protein HOM50_00455 [bacterium]|jgi:hypothetical protein|nr:hypothetical protein [bacterium]MBT5014863.1 hypothetical protein [bacterium]
MIKKIILAGCLLSLGASQLDAREVSDNILGGAAVVVVLGTVGAARAISYYRERVVADKKYLCKAYKELLEVAKEGKDQRVILQKEVARLKQELQEYEYGENISFEESEEIVEPENNKVTDLQQEKAALEEKLRKCEVYQRKYFERLGKHSSAA